MSDSWDVLPHGPLERLAENLWTVEGSLKGMPLKRRMTVARREDGTLVIHSAIALDEAGMAQLEALGRPAVLLVPSAYHRLDAPKYKARYPQITVLAPPRSRKKVAERVAVDGTYDDFTADKHVEVHVLKGTTGIEGAMLVRSADGLTLVVNDVVFNMDKKASFLSNVIFSLMGSSPGPRISRLAKFGIVKDRAVLRQELNAFADDASLVRLIVAHEKISHGADAAATIRQALTFIA